MLWLPTPKLLVLNAAWPVPSTGTLARVVTPSMKVTEPLGVPPRPATVAVKVTDAPKLAGLRLEASAVLVPLLTAWLSAAEALLSQPPEPVNEAVMLWLPTLSVLVLNAAWPVPSTGTVAKVVTPSLKVTEIGRASCRERV